MRNMFFLFFKKKEKRRIYEHIKRGIELSVALETENGVLETLRWLKRQNGDRKQVNHKH